MSAARLLTDDLERAHLPRPGQTRCSVCGQNRRTNECHATRFAAENGKHALHGAPAQVGRLVVRVGASVRRLLWDGQQCYDAVGTG